MKSITLDTFIVSPPAGAFGGRYFLFVKITTDNGLVGYGEVYAAGVGPRAMVAVVEDLFERYVAERDPFRIEALWRRIYGSGFSLRPDTTILGALSGLEMALWDIIGKSLDKPVYELLGGRVHERLRSYTYLYPGPGDAADVYRDADQAAERAVEMVRQGFTAVKFDPLLTYSAFDPRHPPVAMLDHCGRFVARLREAVGSQADLLVGTHGQMTPAAALRLARRMEPSDPLWFEEPVPPDMPETMARVARGTSIPIATGERLTSKYEFARVLSSGAAAILQMDLGRVGGILEAKKICGLAETYHAQIAPHLYCGPLVGAANIQIATCSPNFLILESILRWDGFHADLLKTPITWQEGYVIPPGAPGLGVELDEDVARAHPLTSDRLHLEMAPDPLDDREGETVV